MPDKEDYANAKKLVKYGFFKSGFDKDFKKREEQLSSKSDKDIFKEADIELMEFRKNEFCNTSYPQPFTRFVMTLSEPNQSILEKSYFWIYNNFALDWSFSKAIKITDTFAGSSTSDHWGIMIDRLKNMQQNVSGTMQTIGALVKDLFPMVHELHIWEERIGWHERANSNDKAADISLKGVWTDLVDGGPENGASVLSLGQKIGFLTVPDLFFGTFVKKAEEIDPVVDKLETANEQVKNILRRKLFQYIKWKEENYKEITSRRMFTIRYLRQHINAIRLNMAWLKPYLKQMKYLRQNTNFQDRPNMVSSFDTSMMEIEILFTKKNDDKFKPVSLVSFNYVTFPERIGQAYQYSTVHHAGAMAVTFRGYAWTDEQIENYKKMREDEDIEALGDMDSGFSAAMDALGDEIDKYLKDAGEPSVGKTSAEKIRELEKKIDDMNNKEKDEKKKKGDSPDAVNMYEPFMDVGKAFLDIGKMFIPSKLFEFFKSDSAAEFKAKNDDNKMKGSCKKTVKLAMSKVYTNFRKANKMITW